MTPKAVHDHEDRLAEDNIKRLCTQSQKLQYSWGVVEKENKQINNNLIPQDITQNYKNVLKI